jgi:hypothetical protein
MASVKEAHAMENKKSGLKDKLGEAVEQVGNAISGLGAEKIGKSIHDAGDRMEKTHKNPNHPVEPQVSQDTTTSSKSGIKSDF